MNPINILGFSVNQPNFSSMWLGLDSLGNDGEYIWNDGQPLSSTSKWGGSRKYTKN